MSLKERTERAATSARTETFATLRARLHDFERSDRPNTFPESPKALWASRLELKASTLALALLGGALIVLSSLATAPSAHAAACPNEAIRQNQGTYGKALPECRAYELVSPGVNPFFNVDGYAEVSLASTTGNSFAYQALYPAEFAQTSGPFYLSTRGEDGWSAQAIAAQDSPSSSALFACEQEIHFSSDLSKFVLGDGLHQSDNPYYSYCQSAEEELAPGVPLGYRNLFLKEDATAAPKPPYRLVDVTPETAVPGDAVFLAGSADFSHIVFLDPAQLTPEAPAGASLYEWVNGEVHLVTFSPNGNPTQGEIAGASGYFEGTSQLQHALSADGERVYFTSQGNLYLRQNAAQHQSAVDGEGHCTEPAKACTTEIDESHGSGSSGGGYFDEASVDGSKVFFTDESRLTSDSTATSGASDLYEFDLNRPPSERLSDLTANGSGAGFLGASEDGSYVYFSSPGVLASNKVNNGNGVEEAQPGRANLYMHHAGTTTFVAGFEGDEGGEVSPNGRFLAFSSRDQLTGYDSTPVEPPYAYECNHAQVGGPCTEIFLYDASTGQISCASCGPEGSRPTDGNFLSAEHHFGFATPDQNTRPRNVDDTGRVFFDTKNALVPQDENTDEGHGISDVYEYANGQIHLISAGTEPTASAFYDASPSGNDIFFITDKRLLPSDTNANDSIYDARVDGGFAEPPPPAECEGEACRVGGTAAPGTSSAASASFNAPPEVLPCRKGYVRKHGKCAPRKHHPKKHHRSHRRTANPNRRTNR